MGVVFYDLSSGKGVTYNADVEVYGASSYKALYALYICESLVETGQVSLDDFPWHLWWLQHGLADGARP